MFKIKSEIVKVIKLINYEWLVCAAVVLGFLSFLAYLVNDIKTMDKEIERKLK